MTFPNQLNILHSIYLLHLPTESSGSRKMLSILHLEFEQDFSDQSVI